MCAEIVQVTTDVNLIVLQHPKESKHPLNTANLAALCIPKIEIWISDDFNIHPELNSLLSSNTPVYLLFPAQQAMNLTTFTDNLRDMHSHSLTDVTFIVLDGTWRKCRRILLSTPKLQELPCIQFDLIEQSNYRIRKIPNTNALSTIESIVELLGTLESNRTKFQPLLNVFNKMIDQQIEFMGKDVFQRNYKK